MKTLIEVEGSKEGEAIRRALADPAVRTLVVIMGTLSGHSDRAKRRIMGYVADRLDELPCGHETTDDCTVSCTR